MKSLKKSLAAALAGGLLFTGLTMTAPSDTLTAVSICSAAAQTEYTPEYWKKIASTIPEYAPNKEITGAYNKDLAVKCINGTFVGQKRDDVISFRGIPFAKQPVGELRWKKPQAPEPSNKVFEAVHFGKVCLQPITSDEQSSMYEQGEECLNLNVFVNRKDKTAKKPVMVFIHGGGFIQGGTVDPTYDGYYFVSNNPDVILVTTTYRMGIMGYLNLSSLKGGEKFDGSVNLATLDQIAALKWIKENIAAFGGDPDCVTIFGESAGATSVSSLVISPEAKGLFKRAIAQSAAVSLLQPIENSQALTKKLCEYFHTDSADELAKLKFDDLREYWHNNYYSAYNFPTIDGKILPLDPYGAWENGAAKDYDIMQGCTEDEFRYWITVFNEHIPFFRAVCDECVNYVTENASPEFHKVYKNYLAKLANRYPAENINIEVCNDIFFNASQVFQAEEQKKNGGKSYYYRCRIPMKYKTELFGSPHAAELDYVLGIYDGKSYLGTPEDVELGRKIQRMWVNFAKTGNPSSEGLEWKEYDAKDRYTMILDYDLHLEKNFEAERSEALLKMIKLNNFFAFSPNLSIPVNKIQENNPELFNDYMNTPSLSLE